jgi:hypothetical protein
LGKASLKEPEMTHSLIGADRNTHLKVVAVALVGAIAVVLVGITARVADSGVTIATGSGVMLRAGQPAISASLDATAIR